MTAVNYPVAATSASDTTGSFFTEVTNMVGSANFLKMAVEFLTTGLSIKTYEPVVTKGVKQFIQVLDGLDDPNGKADGLLNRDAIVKKMIEQLDAQMADPKNRNTREQRAQFQAKRGQVIKQFSDRLPEVFTVSDASITTLVENTLARFDTSKDGRIDFFEARKISLNSIADPAAIFSLITPVTPAVPQGQGASVRIPS